MTRASCFLLIATAVAAALVGCQQTRFMTEADFNNFRSQAIDHTAQLPSVADLPSFSIENAPRTTDHPEAKKREITLAECIALAIENGRTGEGFARAGAGRRTSVQGLRTQQSPTNVTDSVRVLAYDPATEGTFMEESLSRFDARWQTSMTWNKVDEPRNVLFGLRGVDNTEEDRASFQTQLIKPLPTGGVAGITYRTSYNFSNINERFGRFNPEYIPVAELTFEQPLFQSAGVGINRLLTDHPGSLLTPFNRGRAIARGIVLTRIDYDNAQTEFERRLHELLFTVEEAYWELYAAYWDFYSRETAARQALATWQIAKVRLEVGKIPGTDFAQIEGQLHQFRNQRLQALNRGLGRPGVLEAERRLRYCIGLQAEDGCRLVPSDTPTVAPFCPDWRIAVTEGIGRRPELNQIRQEIHAAHLNVLVQKNFLLPDLRFLARYNVNALGSRLDGTDENNALRNLFENDFNNWELGLRLDMPLGYREANAQVRRATLGLAQRVAYLQEQEKNLVYDLTRSYRDIAQFHEQIRILRAQRLATAEQLRLRYQEFQAGRGTIDILLEAQRNWAEALREEQFAIADYNVALADWERQKGTIMEHDNVTIAEGALPSCAAGRASEHLRERNRSILLREPDIRGGHEAPGVAPTADAVLESLKVQPGAPIPQLLDEQQKLAPVPETLPPPRPAAGMAETGPVLQPVSGVEEPNLFDAPDAKPVVIPAALPKPKE
jgi:outer membrane protein TolC